MTIHCGIFSEVEQTSRLSKQYLTTDTIMNIIFTWHVNGRDRILSNVPHQIEDINLSPLRNTGAQFLVVSVNPCGYPDIQVQFLGKYGGRGLYSTYSPKFFNRQWRTFLQKS
jgi:hypothetical protein